MALQRWYRADAAWRAICAPFPGMANALDQFFELSMSLHLIAKIDGVIQRVNRGWEVVLGYAKDEVEGRNFLAQVHPDDQAPTLAEMDKLGLGITTIYFENRYRHKNGSFRLLAWSANYSATEQSIYAVANDITERKQDPTKDGPSLRNQRLDPTCPPAALNRLRQQGAELGYHCPKPHGHGKPTITSYQYMTPGACNGLDHCERGAWRQRFAGRACARR